MLVPASLKDGCPEIINPGPSPLHMSGVDGLQVVMMGLTGEKNNMQPSTPGKYKDLRNSHSRPEEAEPSKPANAAVTTSAMS
jgi:hypothetical protein